MKMLPALLLLTLLLLPASAAPALSSGMVLADSTRPRLIILPIVFSSPDTRLAGGILPQVVFRMPGAGRESSFRADAFYTMNGQFTVRLRPTLWFRDDDYAATANVAWKKWPTTFYGIGSGADRDIEEAYTERFVEAGLSAMRRLSHGLYAGVQYDLRHSRLDLEPGSRFGDGSVTGDAGGASSSLGLSLRYDTRNHDFYPTGGGWYQFIARTAAPATGSDYRFSSAELDVRQYASLSDRQTLALQAVVRVTGGDPPFQVLPAVGSVFRGYMTPRFIDANLLAVQAEYRIVPLVWRFGLVGFAGVGQTTRRLEDLSTRDLKYVLGAGLRFQMSRRDAINIRWDYGFGLDSSGDYIDLGEAF
jgi:outer membrane protein assembly factor BamA